MFEKAARMKLRFNHKGVCSVEDLWDLPLKTLDGIYKELNAKIKTQKEESLLEGKSKEDEILSLQIDIVKYIVSVRLAEGKARTDAKARSEFKQKLLAIKEEKQESSLREMSLEDLDKLINEI